MAAKKQDVATTSSNVVPSYLSDFGGNGIDGCDDLVIVPRVKLLQSISDEVEEDDFKSGQFYHSVLEEAIDPIGDQDFIRVIPIRVFRTFTLWRPRKDGGGILARANDGKHWDQPAGTTFEVKLDGSGKKVTWTLGSTVQENGMDKFGSSDPDNPDSEPAATNTINVVVHFPDHPELGQAMVLLQRGHFKVGKQFLTKLKMSRAPTWGRIFEMSSSRVENASGDPYYTFKFKAAGFIPENMVSECEEIHAAFEDIASIRTNDEDEVAVSGGAPTATDSDKSDGKY